MCIFKSPMDGYAAIAVSRRWPMYSRCLATSSHLLGLLQVDAEPLSKTSTTSPTTTLSATAIPRETELGRGRRQKLDELPPMAKSRGQS